MAARLARFVKASMKGWDYAVQNQAEAVKIVRDAINMYRDKESKLRGWG